MVATTCEPSDNSAHLTALRSRVSHANGGDRNPISQLPKPELIGLGNERYDSRVWTRPAWELNPSKNFSGAGRVLDVNYPMARCVLFAGVGLFGLCFPMPAHASDRSARSEILALQPTGASSFWRGLTDSPNGFSSLALGDASLFSFSTGYTSTVNPPVHFLPGLPTAQSPRANAPGISDKDTIDKLELSRPSPVYVSGEVGFLYGISTGKHGGDFSQEYIVGEVGDEHFHISVGASHEESNLRGSRFSR